MTKIPTTTARPDDRADVSAQVSRTDVLPFGPGDFMWDWFGSVVISPIALSAAMLQIMHPVIGAGVEQHSNYVIDPMKRGFDTLAYFNSWIYDPDAARRGRETLRALHHGVEGIDYHGNKYHALNRDPYAFVWLTSLPALIHMRRLKSPAPTTAELEALYDEVKNLGRILGVAEALIPPTYADACTEYTRVCNDVLENTPAVQQFLRTFDNIPAPGVLPKAFRPMWLPVGVLLGRVMGYFNRAYLPPVAREKLGLPWTETDARLLAVFEAILRTAGRAAPILVSQPTVWSMRWRAYRTGLTSEYAAHQA